jgi:hypothetical protein
MPVPNLRRVERAAARYGQALGRTADVAEMEGLADRAHAAPSSRERLAELELARRAGARLLERALAQAEAADRAVEAAVEVLRHVGVGPSWAELGEALGLSSQGAHKRYRHVEAPEPQRTIDDELEASA